MKHERCMRAWCVALLAVGLLGAMSAEDAADFVRKGDAAFEGGDFEAAVDFYQRAEETITDPGLVAFNKGAALYRLGRYRDAAAHYRRTLGDATGGRRARVLYDLGNALLQEGQDRDARLLQQAVRSYTDCLAEPEVGPELAEDAKSNLALARALLQKARARKPSQQEAPDEHEPDPSPPDNPRNRQQPGDYAVGPQGRDVNGVPTPGPQVGPENRQAAVETPQTAPGEGNRPPVPDQDQVANMSAEDTEQYVREQAARILREQREHWRSSTAVAPPGMRNW